MKDILTDKNSRFYKQIVENKKIKKQKVEKLPEGWVRKFLSVSVGERSKMLREGV